MNKKQILVIMAFAALAVSDTSAQSKLGLNYTSFYHFNSDYRIGPGTIVGESISRLSPTWGTGASVEYQKPLKRNWYFGLATGLNNSYKRVDINYPLERFSPVYSSGQYFQTSYNTPSETNFSLYFKFAKTLNPKNRLKISPYFSLIALWTLTHEREYHEEWFYEGQTFSSQIISIEGYTGGARPRSGFFNALTYVNPLYALGIDVEYRLKQNLIRKIDRPISFKLDIGYSSLWPILGDGPNPIYVYAKRNDLGLEERLFGWENFRRLNFNIGVMVPIRRDNVKPKVDLSQTR